MLRGSLLGGSGLALAAMLGCGEDDEDEPAAPADDTGAAGTTTATAAGEADDTAAERTDGLTTPGGNFLPHQFPEPAGVTPQAGGTLVQAVTWDVGPMDPALSAAGGTIGPARAVYNRIIGFVSGPEATPFEVEYRPELASSWETSPDGLTYTFHLNEGITWQNVDPLNGRGFTSADVQYAWNRYAAEGAQAQYWTNVAEITAPDELTVEVRLNQPQPDFIVPLASRYLGIFPRELVEDGTIESRAIGTGPMIQTEVSPGQRVLYEKNPDYFEKEVLLDGLELRILPDGSSRLAGLRVGQFHHAQTPVGSASELDSLLGSNPDLLTHAVPAESTYYALAFNQRDPASPFTDERVRRALSLGMDRQAIIDIVFGGFGTDVSTIPWLFLFEEQPTAESGLLGEWWRHDPEEARGLLSAAGVEGLNFGLTYFTYSPNTTSQIELITDQMRQIGVDVRPASSDYTEYNSQWIQNTYQEATYGWAANGFSADNFFHNQLHSTASGNRYGINDPQIDEWAEAQQVELDPAARKEILRQIWDRVHDQVWRVDIPYAHGFEVFEPTLHNVRFVGPMLTNYSFTEIGAQVQDAWIEK